MNANEKYVCAFRGRRDSYQVAIALEEHGLLQELVADLYAYEWMTRFSTLLPDRLAEKLNSRRAPEISDRRVTTMPWMVLRERIRQMLGTPARVCYAQTASQISLAAARAARTSRANLLLYHSYAWDAFTAKYSHQPRRVLFQYHPHYGFEETVYSQDGTQFPEYAGELPSAALAGVPGPLREHLTDSWKHADLIICASSFTKQSLLWAGADERKCRVVSYGNDAVPTAAEERPDPETFQVLFVGTGGPRKGLHHLLMAWQQLRVPFAKKLILVCQDISPGVRALASRTPNVQLLPGATRRELIQLYAASHLFAMPSLVEGFGLVYLEALTYGCPVLGTRNSGLPDLGGADDGIFLVTPGDVDELTHKLQTLASELMASDSLRQAAKRCAEARQWRGFRRGIVNALAEA